jgi:3-dehydroquinate dehydratase II
MASFLKAASRERSVRTGSAVTEESREPDRRCPERPQSQSARQARAGDVRSRDARRRRGGLPPCRQGTRAAIEFHQSNREYEIIDLIHAARERAAGIVINPAAFTHTSAAILDALNAFEGPIIEVHISNVHKREPFRHHSYVSAVASGVIVGCGTQGYAFALQRIAKLIAASKR